MDLQVSNVARALHMFWQKTSSPWF